MLVGYARVSTVEQNLDLQTDALRDAGCSQVFTDHLSGAVSARPGLVKACAALQQGDALVVWKIDRLGRTVKGLVDLVESLGARGVGFRSLTDRIDTDGPQGKFFFHVMAAFAQMERELVRERTRSGLAAARARGRIGGRPQRMTAAKFEAAQGMRASGAPARDVAQAIGVSIPTLYRWLATDPAVAGARLR